MNDPLSRFFVNGVTLSIERGPDGLMTVAMSTGYIIHDSDHSQSSAKITERWHSPRGWANSLGKWLLTAALWVLSSTSEKEWPTQMSSTPHSHSGCWCNSSRKQATND